MFLKLKKTKPEITPRTIETIKMVDVKFYGNVNVTKLARMNLMGELM